MSWIEIKIDVPQEKMEEISGYLFAQGCEGIHLADEGVLIYFNQFRWSEEIRLALVDFIQEIVPAFSNRHMRIVSVADQDWNKYWKDFFKPVYITNTIVVRPPWEEWTEKHGEQVITINPQMAFGTGHHESTQLIARALEKWQKTGMHILDIGTGSGILAIIAARLGAASVVAIDNDPIALKNALENVRLNKNAAHIHFFVAQPEDLQPAEYDIILANINRNVLIKYAKQFPKFLNPNGKLILSGLLLTDEVILLNTYESAGFRLISKSAMKEWLSLVFELRENKKNRQESVDNGWKTELSNYRFGSSDRSESEI